eukprot:TRINITY_DN27931_c0_g1_i1.p2 TRINITY_DN27931_c0_g1~~TRINITY_DN27931_c0_g1_i1.p2  ORF type:complete len:274 (+),score=74.79 TRINITY_DN27931_c0_g1_i1:82-822(+)
MGDGPPPPPSGSSYYTDSYNASYLQSAEGELADLRMQLTQTKLALKTANAQLQVAQQERDDAFAVLERDRAQRQQRDQERLRRRGRQEPLERALGGLVLRETMRERRSRGRSSYQDLVSALVPAPSQPQPHPSTPPQYSAAPGAAPHWGPAHTHSRSCPPLQQPLSHWSGTTSSSAGWGTAAPGGGCYSAPPGRSGTRGAAPLSPPSFPASPGGGLGGAAPAPRRAANGAVWDWGLPDHRSGGGQA